MARSKNPFLDEILLSNVTEREPEMTPECRLWRKGVLWRTYMDFEIELNKIQRSRGRKNGPSINNSLKKLSKLWRQVESTWFDQICDMANVDKSKFVLSIRLLHKKYKAGDLIPGYQ